MNKSKTKNKSKDFIYEEKWFLPIILAIFAIVNIASILIISILSGDNSWTIGIILLVIIDLLICWFVSYYIFVGPKKTTAQIKKEVKKELVEKTKQKEQRKLSQLNQSQNLEQTDNVLKPVHAKSKVLNKSNAQNTVKKETKSVKQTNTNVKKSSVTKAKAKAKPSSSSASKPKQVSSTSKVKPNQSSTTKKTVKSVKKSK